MLILSRKPNEQIVIGQNIVVTVVAISGGHVRLGIEAPRDIPVHREEVYRAVAERKSRQASTSDQQKSPGEAPQPPPSGEPHADQATPLPKDSEAISGM